MKNISRRKAIKTLIAGGAVWSASNVSAISSTTTSANETILTSTPLKGNIRHSVSKWCFGGYELDEFCGICKSIGIESIE